MLIPDRVEENAVFTDEEIDAYLGMNDSNVRRAAAEALETIASDEAMTLKVISTLDITTNGASTSAAILERAKLLRQKADDDDAAGLDDPRRVVERRCWWGRLSRPHVVRLGPPLLQPQATRRWLVSPQRRPTP
jgi:hypothetical protein